MGKLRLRGKACIIVLTEIHDYWLLTAFGDGGLDQTTAFGVLCGNKIEKKIALRGRRHYDSRACSNIEYSLVSFLLNNLAKAQSKNSAIPFSSLQHVFLFEIRKSSSQALDDFLDDLARCCVHVDNEEVGDPVCHVPGKTKARTA